VDQRKRFERDAVPLLGRVLAVARTFTRNEAEAEDLVQDTYVRALERFHQFEEGTNLIGWLGRIAYTQFVNKYRMNQLRKTESLKEELHSPDEPEYVPDPAATGAFAGALLSPAVREGMDQRMAQALGRLSPELHYVLILCVVGEMRYREAASALAIPIGTVMSRLSRAKAALREELLRLTGTGPSRGIEFGAKAPGVRS